MAKYILSSGLDVTARPEDLFARFCRENPGRAYVFKISDVYNALALIRDGFTIDESPEPQPKRKRGNPIKRGGPLEFASYAAKEGHRFDAQQKALIVESLRVEWGVA